MVAKGLKAFSFANPSSPIGEINLVIEMPIPYEQLKSRAIFIKVKKIEIPVIALDDLIRLKKESGRQQDLRDLDNLEKIRGG